MGAWYRPSKSDDRRAQVEQERQRALADAQLQQVYQTIAQQQQEQTRLQQLAADAFAQERAKQAQQLAKATEEAQAAQRAAEEANYRASLGPADSNDARTAQERLLRRLAGRRGFAAGVQSGAMGAAPTAAKALTGA